MKIYVGHSSSIDFEKNLYKPIRDSGELEDHKIIFPHETEGLFDSKTFLEEECGLMVAEVSEASTGLGIELGWADLFNVDIMLLSRENSDPSSSLKALNATHIKYQSPEKIPSIIQKKIEERK